MKTMVYISGALGDFITILPVLELWKKFTKSYVVLLGKPEHGSIAQMSGYIDEVLDMDRKCNMIYFSLSDSDEISKQLSGYTHIMLFTFQNSPIAINCKNKFHGSLYIQEPFPLAGIHVVDYHCQLIRDVVSLPDPVIPKVKISDNDPLKVNKNIIIQRGSGSNRKNWSIENYLVLADKIRKKGYKISWIEGPAEDEINVDADDIVHRNESLVDISKILYQSKLYIGNDSGISHLAAACGCAVISLFGPSDPLVWAPRGEREIKIVYKKVHCSPCHPYRKPDMSICQLECLHQITPDEIFSMIEELY